MVVVLLGVDIGIGEPFALGTKGMCSKKQTHIGLVIGAMEPCCDLAFWHSARDISILYTKMDKNSILTVVQ